MMKKTGTAKKEPVQAATVQAKPKAMTKQPAAAKKSAAAPKPAAPTKPLTVKVQAGKKAAPAAKEKVKKPKLVRDSFTMPEAEYAVLGEVKKLCLKAGVEVKKSELLRIGVAHIRSLSLLELKKAIGALVPLKAGRPKKDK